MYNIQNIKIEIEDYKLEADRAERNGDYGKVAEIRYGKIQEAEKELDRLQQELEENQKGTSLIKEEVTYEDIAEVVAKWTGVPRSEEHTSELQSRPHLVCRLLL